MSNANDFVIKNGCLKEYVGTSKDVVIPDGVTTIGDEAFSHCEMLKNMPKNIRSPSWWWNNGR